MDETRKMFLTQQRLERRMRELENFRFIDLTTISPMTAMPGGLGVDEVYHGMPEKVEGMTFALGDEFIGRDRYLWAQKTVMLPAHREGCEAYGVFDFGKTGGGHNSGFESLLYVDGHPYQGVDTYHNDVNFESLAGKTVQLTFMLWTGLEGGGPKREFRHLFRQADLGYLHKATDELYYLAKAIVKETALLDDNSTDKIALTRAIEHAFMIVDWDADRFYDTVDDALATLKAELAELKNTSEITVNVVGHTHIDVAWLWRLKHTREKAQRSFATVLRLMNEFDEYVFLQSQPQLYQYIKKDCPEIYEQMKTRIAEGRWEADGGMWLEADCNISSGESLIRHIIYGRRFFEQELGAEKNEVLWLPDVFGYSAALPQILQKSGIPYFMTTKIGWNEFNRFPHDTFLWKGIDGTEVLTHLISTRNYQKPGDLKMVGNHSTTYNGLQNASQLMGTWQRYQDKDVSTEVLTCYGYGDGGGGPPEEMLEQSRRLEHSIVECPAARQTGVKEFFHILEDKMDKKRLAVWDGELYLEFHRGTYTSMAQNKKYNRKAEFKNGETELYAAMASLLDQKYLYPQEQLEHSWKLLLLNQFHDILPGSSIKEVYEDSAAQYEEIFAADEEMMKTAKKSIREKLFRYRAEKNEEVCAVWNPLSFARTALIRNAEGSWQKITAGPSGVTVCRAVNSGEDNCFTELVMEENGRPVSFKTPYFTVRFDANAEITSLVDIREDRELIQKGRMGNRLTVYEDRPAEFDAWNIDEGYLEKSWDVIDVEEFKVLENGPETAALHVRRRFQDSMIEQTIRFYRHTARIDFQTRVDWQEHQQLLRVSFPVDILAHEADYEIQFGNVKRPTHKNTSWDRARFEVCAHKWADLSEPGYGVALMNDCKYGYDVHEGVMGLTLIKSGIFPNPDADQGQHEFTYALFPHQGDFRKGSVVREAYDLNCPMAWEKVQGIYEDSFSMLQIAEENVMADTVKAAEDGNGIIVRIYETWGMRTKVHVNFPLAPDAQVTVCDCMENFSGVENADMTRAQDGWSFTMKPYEIKTLRIVNEKK